MEFEDSVLKNLSKDELRNQFNHHEKQTGDDELDYDLDVKIKAQPHEPIEHRTEGCSNACSNQCGSGPCTGNCTKACSVRCPTKSYCCDPDR